MANKTQDFRPDDTAAWYDCQLDQWKRATDLMGGTKSMREAGSKYLPQFPGESDKNYERRLEVATLHNFWRQMAREMVGRIFSKKIEIEGSQIPEDILNNIDSRGNSVHTFARSLALKFLTKGMWHLFIDMPRPSITPTNLAEERELNLRPRWISWAVESVFNGALTESAGFERLLQIRSKSTQYEVRGLEISCFSRITIYDDNNGNVSFKVYDIQDDNTKSYTERVDLSGVMRGISQIPLVTFYTERLGFMQSMSLMDDIALKNIEHWQSSSDQRNILTVSRYPILTQIGVDKPITVDGPANGLWSPGNDKEKQPVEFKFIEPEGSAIQHGWKDLERIVTEAEALGMQLVVRPTRDTVIEAVRDDMKDTSPLQDFAQAFEEGLTKALQITGEWLGYTKEQSGRAIVNKDFGISAQEEKRIDALIRMRGAKDLSRETYWEEMKEVGVLQTKFEKGAELARIRNEEDFMPEPTPNVP